MTTEVLKKLSPSPSLGSESCECRQCIERSVSPKASRTSKSKSPSTKSPDNCNSLMTTLVSSSSSRPAENCDNMDKDLDDLVYSLIMLIVEGRTFSNANGSRSGESLHAKPLIDSLIKKVLCLNQMAMANIPGDSGSSKAVTDQKYPAEHVCSNRHNTQCRIALKLKDKVERCIQSHFISIEKEADQKNISINNASTEETLSTNTTSFFNKDLHLHPLKAITPEPPLQQQQVNYDSDNTKLPFNNSPASFLLNTSNSPISNTNNSTNIKRSSFLPSIRNQNQSHSSTTETNITINVYLLPVCCFDEEYLVNGGDCLLDKQDLVTFELLESWSITMISNQKNEQQSKAKLLTLNELFQAIRSYLHFSQISSWINQSGGQQPKNIAYSVNYSSKKCPIEEVNQQLQSTATSEVPKEHFDFQTFPSLNLLLANNKFYVGNTNSQLGSQLTATQLQVSLLSRKRTGNRNQPLVDCIGNHTTQTTKTTTSSITQPISIGGGLKLPSNITNASSAMVGGNKHFLLPHWSSIMTSPHMNQQLQPGGSDHEIDQPKLAQTWASPNSDLTPDTTPVQTPTNIPSQQQQFKFPSGLSLFHSANTTSTATTNNSSSINNVSSSAQFLSNSPITTPTSFPDSLPFPHLLSIQPTNNQHQSASNQYNISPPSSHFQISQSPKVLVSNHQLLSDLCSQLSIESTSALIDPINSCGPNKRKFTSESDSDTQPIPLTKYTDETTELASNDNNNECQFDNKQCSNPLKIITTRITGDLQDISTVTIKNSSFEQQQSTKESQHLLTNANVHNRNISSSSPCDVNNNQVVDTNSLSNSPRKLTKFSNIKFNTRSNLPLSSSPAPLRKSGSSLFDFDNSLKNPRSIKNALSNKLLNKTQDDVETDDNNNLNQNLETDQKNPLAISCESSDKATDGCQHVVLKHRFANKNNYTNSFKNFNMQLSYSNSALVPMPLTPHCLLGNFEESLLNGRMNPVGVVDGFYAEIGASGSFFPEHVTIPVHAAFYQVCEDVAASPYLGVINLANVGKRGYKVPNKGTIQVTLFNPNNTVVKMFVVMYDLSDMPPGHRTFLRQRTMYVPLVSSNSSSSSSSNGSGNAGNSGNGSPKPVNKMAQNGRANSKGLKEEEELKSYLRYLIHLRFATSKSGKLYLHTNIKLIFARNKCEIDPRLAKYEYKTFTESPKNPRYSPKK